MLEFETGLREQYDDLLSPAVLSALEALAPLDEARKALMSARLERRTRRASAGERVAFLRPDDLVPGAALTVQQAREGAFVGAPIPPDLTRQWIQGTGPGAKPRVPLARSIRNVAHALLSGADGWMFDGEDALGQLSTMSLDNQRNLRLALRHDSVFMSAAESVAREMNAWSQGFFGRAIVDDWRKQLSFTTVIFRPRGLHLDDRHVRRRGGDGFSASFVDAVLFVANNHQVLRDAGRSLVLYLPKIQTAAEAALWNDALLAVEQSFDLPIGTIKTYVLVEQFEACFQLMEIRAALGLHFVGFNTGRWDYINSVADALAWDRDFVNPNIDAVTMTYGYMRAYEDRVRRAVNTPDARGRYALWQGGMEPNIPVGSPDGVARGMARAVGGAEREQREGASGKWVAHWKMVHIVRPVWERAGEPNQMGRSFPRLTYTEADAAGLMRLEPAPRTTRGARELISVAMQYGNAFGQGMQAAALKPADAFGDDNVLYLMEDMATGEIRLSILWEWVHKSARVIDEGGQAGQAGTDEGEIFSADTFSRLLAEEYEKLLAASNRDVHDDSKATTLPIARAIVDAYVRDPVKLPWYIDLLNITLGVTDLVEGERRIHLLRNAFVRHGERVTTNLDFTATDDHMTR